MLWKATDILLLLSLSLSPLFEKTYPRDSAIQDAASPSFIGYTAPPYRLKIGVKGKE